MATLRVEPVVCFGSSQRSWVTDLISYVSDHGGMRVVGTVLTQDDALAMAYDVLVIDDVSSVLTPRLVDRLHAAGRVVVGVCDPERGVAAQERVLAAGVDSAVAADAPAGELVRAVNDALRQRGIDEEFAGLVDEFAGESGPTEPADPVPGDQHGIIVTVAGSDGATEVAAGVAGLLVRRGVSCVLVDMDTVEPSVAQRLGVRLTPNIFTATEHLRLRSSLEDAFSYHPEGFAVIAGIPNPREWENLSEGEAADLVTELATGFEVVVVKTSRHLEDLSGMAGGPGRFDIGRRMMAVADQVLVVTSASPLGMTRLLTLIGDQSRLTAAPTHVVVNQAPPSQFVRGEISDELHRSLTPSSLTFLPIDQRVRKASWQGELVTSGPFLRRLSRVVDQVTPRSAPSSRFRRSAGSPEPRPTETVPLESSGR